MHAIFGPALSERKHALDSSKYGRSLLPAQSGSVYNVLHMLVEYIQWRLALRQAPESLHVEQVYLRILNCKGINILLRNGLQIRGALMCSPTGTGLFKRLYDRTRLPIVPIYGGFPVKLR